MMTQNYLLFFINRNNLVENAGIKFTSQKNNT